MDKYVINGGNKLKGSVKIESAKNAVLPIICASLMTKEEVVILDCPKISDVTNLLKILNSLGVKHKFEKEKLIINPSNVSGYKVPYKLSKNLRSSIFLLGPLLSRKKKAEISYPGGCDIGKRPIDIHVKGLKELGVNVTLTEDGVSCKCDKIPGNELYLSFPSVGATENLICASVFCNGETVIKNAAREPEIVDLVNFLNLMGAKIKGAGTPTVTVKGVKTLHGVEYKPIPDRIEAGTYLLSALITGGEIELLNVNEKNIKSLIDKISNNTCKVSMNNDIINVKSFNHISCCNLRTGPYPEFPTDLQAQTMALLSVSKCISSITETVFENRFCHVEELKKMGAKIRISGRTAIIYGVNSLHGAEVYSHDLRGGAAMVLAGLSASGKTVVFGRSHIERGYLDLDKKLRSLGAAIIKE